MAQEANKCTYTGDLGTRKDRADDEHVQKEKKHKGKQRHSTRRSNDEHAHTSRGQQTKEKRGMWREVEEGRQHHTDTPVENEMSVNNSGIQITHTTEKKMPLFITVIDTLAAAAALLPG